MHSIGIIALLCLRYIEAIPLSPSGGVEGSRWFEQMASAINQPVKPGFQDPGMNQPFQEPVADRPFQQPNQGPPSDQTPKGFQQPQNQPFPAKQPSLFELLFGPVFADPDFAEPQGFQNQPPECMGQQPQGFETNQAGTGSQGGFGFQNAGFQQSPPPNTGFQQNANPGFQPNSNPEFQGQNPGFQPQPQGQQPGFGAQQNANFNPNQSELSLFNNLLRNFFMW